MLFTELVQGRKRAGGNVAAVAASDDTSAGEERIAGCIITVGTAEARIQSPVRACKEGEGKGEAVSMGAVAKNTLENAFEHINRLLV
jgi:hypothetical protein